MGILFKDYYYWLQALSEWGVATTDYEVRRSLLQNDSNDSLLPRVNFSLF